jgi:hypothetical protein
MLTRISQEKQSESIARTKKHSQENNIEETCYVDVSLIVCEALVGLQTRAQGRITEELAHSRFSRTIRVSIVVIIYGHSSNHQHVLGTSFTWNQQASLFGHYTYPSRCCLQKSPTCVLQTGGLTVELPVSVKLQKLFQFLKTGERERK